MIEHFAVTWLVNALWLVPLIATTAVLCTRFARSGPRARHGAWMTALVLAASLPAFPSVLPALRLAPAVAPRKLSSLVVPLVADPAALPSVVRAPPADPLPLLAFDQGWARAVLCLVGGFVAIALCRLLLAVRAGQRLVGAAQPCELDPDVQRILGPAREARRAPQILESAVIAGPVVVGAARPAILVPPGFVSLPWDEQRAALLHEMAHVVRRDYAWNLVCEAVSLPLAWHPAILPIKAGVRRSREAACDALAAEAMASRVTYAKCLVSLATRLGAARPSSALVVGLIGKSDLEERLMTLLNPRPDRVSSALRMAGAIAIAATVLVPAVLLRVTPAFADEPVVARRLLAPAPDTAIPPAAVAAPAAAVAVRATPKHVARVQRIASLDATTPMQPPAPPAQVAPAPPAPPPPPAAEPMNGEERHYHMAHGHYDAIIHRAVEEALSTEKVMEADAMRRAMAEIRAHEAQMSRAEQARVHAEVTTALAEIDHEHLKETLDKLKTQLGSAEFRHAIADAAREAAKAAVEADDGKD